MPGSDDDAARPRVGGSVEGALDETVPSSDRLQPAGTAFDATKATDSDALRASDVVIQRGERIGRYEIVQRLGSGTMGVVLSAIDPMLDRKVAIKLVRAGHTGSTIGRQRLMREAQAMAKLSHPNVVTVFEVGTHAERVFLAMEYIAGSTLGEWLPGRSRREILNAFTAAGEGLAAAHRAGIVHRDFKPANVLVSTDGRVRVADFGLATAPDVALEGEEAARASAENLSAMSMTRTGAILGTPAYMSPEQHRGKPAGARADQFSFCVALYEALYGELPFAGNHYGDYAENVLEGRVREAPRGTTVPVWLRKVITRGLAVDPDKRYASMDALLDDLRRDPAARRRQIMLGAAGIVALVGVAVLVGRSGGAERAGDPCATADQPLAGLWSTAEQAAMRKAFAATGLGGAAGAYERTARILDKRATALRAARREACIATAVRHEQSADLLDRRMACIDRRAAETEVLVSILTDKPDAGTVLKAVDAASALPSIAPCADRTALLAAVSPPTERAVRDKVDAIGKQLDRAEALEHAGRYRDALALVQAQLAETDATGYLPLRARAHFLEANIFAELGESVKSADKLRATGELAAAAHDDELLARSWSLLYGILGSRLGRFDEAKALEPMASAAVLRAGDSPEQRGFLENARGAVALGRGEYTTAADRFKVASELEQKAYGDSDPRVANTLANAATALEGAGRYDEAKQALDRALAIRTEVLGPDHPDTAHSHFQSGTLLDSTGHPEESLAAFEKAVAIDKIVYGEDSIAVATDDVSIGIELYQLGRAEESLAHEQHAVAIFEQHADDQQVRLINALGGLADAYRVLQRNDEAIKTYERTVALARKVYGDRHSMVATYLNNMGLAVYQAGNGARARQLWTEGLAIREATLGPDHPEVAMSLGMLASDAGERGDHPEAVRLLTRAIPIAEKHKLPLLDYLLDARGKSELALRRYAEAITDLQKARDGFLGNGQPTAATRLMLANALWAQGSKDAARDQVTAAQNELDKQGKDADAAVVAQVRTWLRAHK